MQPNNIDSGSEYLSDTQEGNIHGPGNIAVYELNENRAEALRLIDECGLSCVTSLVRSLSYHTCSPVTVL